jgi:amino acid adenylation domain-containing protein
MVFLLQHLLTESAQKHPNNVALRWNGESLTYADVEAFSNQTARALQRAGVLRGDRVGICVHKSPASVINIFGILKAGGVYVPLDPNAPASRLGYILQNCNVKVILAATDTLKGVVDLVAKELPLRHVILTDARDEVPEELTKAIPVTTWEDVLSEDVLPVSSPGTIETDLAYILYTSGSTGVPKGVMISHRTIFTFVNWAYETFGVAETDRVTSHAPIHFDLSTFDIFVTIKAGGTVVLVPEKLSIFPVKLVELLQQESVTITYLVPSILSLIVNYGRLDTYDLSSLRLILFAGEVFPIKYLRRLVEAIPHPDYYNLYGPTETNVCTYYRVRPEDVAPEKVDPVPIGRACENIEVFAVGDDGEIVSEPGREGELWVRGSCVAQGYWGNPQRTAENFVPNIFQPHFDEIAYRTGDIVTLAEDGENWIFVGRRDHMIKSRGYRIELGEIESALYSFQGIKEAAVVAIPDDLIGNRIKAFVVSQEDSNLTINEVKQHCSQRLPGYMVPEIVEFMSELPKTSTGKIDRAELAPA